MFHTWPLWSHYTGALIDTSGNMDMENVQLYIVTWIALDMRQNCLNAPNMFILILLVIQVNTSLVFCVVTVSI